MWYSILLKSSIFLQYSSLVQSNNFFLFFFILFFFLGMTWIVKLSGLTLSNKPLNGLHAMHDIQEVSCVKKCKSLHQMFFMNCQRRWPGTTPDIQTKFMLLFFGHKCLPFSLTWQVSLTCKSEFLRENKKLKKKKKKKKECLYVRQRDRKDLDCMKSRK